jgi:hypothetical protein
MVSKRARLIAFPFIAFPCLSRLLQSEQVLVFVGLVVFAMLAIAEPEPRRCSSS